MIWSYKTYIHGNTHWAGQSWAHPENMDHVTWSLVTDGIPEFLVAKPESWLGS